MPQNYIVQELLDLARDTLRASSDSVGLDTQVWLAHVLETDRAWILAHTDEKVSPEKGKAFINGVDQMAAGRPLPYLLGKWEFYGFSYLINESVLIPRPETELLVDQALNWLKHTTAPIRMADVGTGSGCIGISIANLRSDLAVTAIDISSQALNIARQNIEKHKLEDRVSLIEGDLLENTQGKFNLICANLPYIPIEHLERLEVVKAEPRIALDGGNDGMELLRRCLIQAKDRITADSCILAEIDPSYAKEIEEFAQANFPQSTCNVLMDLAGRERLLRITHEE